MMRLTASTKPQFATGPQKCVVLGPVGLFTNAMKRAPMPAILLRHSSLRAMPQDDLAAPQEGRHDEQSWSVLLCALFAYVGRAVKDNLEK